MDSPIPKKKKRISVTTNDAGDYILQQGSGDDGGLPTCGSQPQSSYFSSDAPSSSRATTTTTTTSFSNNNNPPSNNNNSKPFLAIGQEVNITSRTWSGINKPGGHAKITNIHYNDTNEAKMVDVKYALGGKEQNIQLKYVTEPTMELGTRGNRRNNNRGGSGSGGEDNTTNNRDGEKREAAEINSLAQGTAVCLFTDEKEGGMQQLKKQSLPQDTTSKSSDREKMKKEQSSQLKVSASMLSLPCEPFNTPKEDEK